MKRRTRVRLAAFFGVCVVGYACLVLIDGPPFEDGDLQLVRRTVALRDNGFALVDLSEEDFDLNPDRPLPAGAFYEGLLGDGAWDAREFQEIVDKNGEVLQRLDRCLERPDLLGPADQGFDADLNYVLAWGRLSALVSIKVRLLLEGDKPHQALEEALKLGRFGQRIQSSQGNCMVFFIGRSIKLLGLENIRRVLDHEQLESGILLAGIAELMTLRNDFNSHIPFFVSFVPSWWLLFGISS